MWSTFSRIQPPRVLVDLEAAFGVQGKIELSEATGRWEEMRGCTISIASDARNFDMTAARLKSYSVSPRDKQ